MPEKKPIELEGIIKNFRKQLKNGKLAQEYGWNDVGDMEAFIQSTYLLGVKAGKLELIDKIKNSTIESYNGDLVENLPPREAFVRSILSNQ